MSGHRQVGPLQPEHLPSAHPSDGLEAPCRDHSMVRVVGEERPQRVDRPCELTCRTTALLCLGLPAGPISLSMSRPFSAPSTNSHLMEGGPELKRS